MTEKQIVMFCFAGRRPNMELQLPFIRRILEDHPNARYDIWNLARDNGDDKWLRTVEGDRITVHSQFRKISPGYDQVYKYYSDKQYKNCVFVKFDDDIVFAQTDRFAQFVKAIHAHPKAILSANTINNGACTPLESGLWNKFQRIGIPLLDVHKNAGYANTAHNYFFDHHLELLAQPVELIPTTDWLSINLIGYTWPTGCEFATRIGSHIGTRGRPIAVAGRPLHFLGDEGIANTLPKIVMRGFLAAHLTFGPQNLTITQLIPWRERYTKIGEQYLASASPHPDMNLPELSETSATQPEDPTCNEIQTPRWGGDIGAEINNPAVGRYVP